MLSLEKCKSIVKKHGYNYTDEQIVLIRDLLYKLAAVEFKVYQRRKNENEESDHLHPRIVGRAG